MVFVITGESVSEDTVPKHLDVLVDVMLQVSKNVFGVENGLECKQASNVVIFLKKPCCFCYIRFVRVRF